MRVPANISTSAPGYRSGSSASPHCWAVFWKSIFWYISDFPYRGLRDSIGFQSGTGQEQRFVPLSLPPHALQVLLALLDVNVGHSVSRFPIPGLEKVSQSLPMNSKPYGGSHRQAWNLGPA